MSIENNLTIVPLMPEHALQVASWYWSDVDKAYIGFYTNASKWLELIEGDKNRTGWAALLGDELVGFLDLEIDGDLGYIAYSVKPIEQGRGIGKAMIKALFEISVVKQLKSIEAYVEESNIASQKVLLANNFKQMGYDKDGLMKFQAKP